MKMILINTCDAPDDRTRNEWLDHQPIMNREIRHAGDIDDIHVYTKTRLLSYIGIDYSDGNCVEMEDITTTGWWVDKQAVFFLRKKEVI